MRSLPAWALLAFLPAAAADDGTLVTAQGIPLQGKDIRIVREGEELLVHYTDATGTHSLKAADVVELSLGAPRAPSTARPLPEDVEILLSSGDTLTGKLGARSVDGIQLVTPVYGNPLVKFEQVRTLLFPANRGHLPKSLPPKVESDIILTRAGDQAEGTLLALSASGVEYKSRRLDREVTLKIEEVAGLRLAELQAPPREPATLLAIVLTDDGSSMRGQIESLKEGILTLRDLFGTLHKIPAHRVACIYMKNGRVAYLSDMDPSHQAEDANYIRGPEKLPGDLDYPFQRDRSARGTFIVLGGITHRKGLGVRAHSALTYPLAGSFRKFQAVFGLDAESRGLGAVTGEVWVDGRKIREITLKGADGPQNIDVDLPGAKELRLVATWAGHGQSDFAGWGSARLIR